LIVSRSSRNLTVRFVRWLTLVLFGGTSLLGQGLHLFSNCGCGGCHSHANSGVPEAAASAASSHSCRHGCRWHTDKPGQDNAAAASADNGQPRWQSFGCHDDDCFICRFLAQSQHARSEAPLVSCRFVRPHRLSFPVDQPLLSAIEPYQARGPPAQA
jgi:hypothetical protein